MTVRELLDKLIDLHEQDKEIESCDGVGQYVLIN